MKVEVKNDKETKFKPGDIVALKNHSTKKEEYYLVTYNDHFCSLANVENGQLFKKDELFRDSYSSIAAFDDLIKKEDGKVYSGDKAKLILKGDAN